DAPTRFGDRALPRPRAPATALSPVPAQIFHQQRRDVARAMQDANDFDHVGIDAVEDKIVSVTDDRPFAKLLKPRVIQLIPWPSLRVVANLPVGLIDGVVETKSG